MIQDHSELWCIKGTDESAMVTDSSAALMHHELSDLGSLILIIPKNALLDCRLNLPNQSIETVTNVGKPNWNTTGYGFPALRLAGGVRRDMR